MKSPKEHIVDILKKSGNYEFQSRILSEIKAEIEKGRESYLDKKYRENQTTYDKQKAIRIERGKLFKKRLKPGMVVICRGTKDRKGYRYVVKLEKKSFTAIKLIYRHERVWGFGLVPRLVVDSYYTEHGYDKVSMILLGDHDGVVIVPERNNGIPLVGDYIEWDRKKVDTRLRLDR